ncbi:MAG: hypothetical protein IE933_13490 [Sphingomonadales bacterium]|nr:hypothetical protein [Sphingomonadales bacterium]MBD3773785.1 hypothetical protein [Paracoccaceae bacterium]
MATLILSTIGTVIGGPIGGAIGAALGGRIDGAIFGTPGREGPRVKELAVTTSSYGQAIPRHAGQMRTAGTVIWATDLVEHRETSGGGKGKPKLTSYSYSISFAVALSSSPIDRVGRIWADGNLLRGAAGDLKVPGTLRIHCGSGSQQPDPLIAAAQGGAAPAHRGLAYVVFEDLQLADFGNRIPALTFEIFASVGSTGLGDVLAETGFAGDAQMQLPGLHGFAHEGGTIGDLLATIDSLYPLACDCSGAGLTLQAAARADDTVLALPEAASGWDEESFGVQQGSESAREAGAVPRPQAVRYYDTARDFQPGLQRAGGRAEPGYARTIEFPGALAASDARALVDDAARRAALRRERLSWRVAELDPAIRPGVVVRAPGMSGTWLVESWEWRERGIELALSRHRPGTAAPLAADPGTVPPPLDAPLAHTVLQAFELPWDGIGSSDAQAIHAAVSADSANWRGAALFVERDGELLAAGTSGRQRAVVGTTLTALPASPGLLFAPSATLDIQLGAEDLSLAPATLAALANGANRLLVGRELLQFSQAVPLGSGAWRLTGLLRGRGGSEASALEGAEPGTPVALVDESLAVIDPALASPVGASGLAAIGAGDAEPVRAPIANPGATLRPPAPVHPRCWRQGEGGMLLRWTRRARGQWCWPAEIELPLVEQAESYRVGLGPADSPIMSWQVAVPQLTIPAETLAAIAADHANEALWVRQIGSHALSDPLLLCRIA